MKKHIIKIENSKIDINHFFRIRKPIIKAFITAGKKSKPKNEIRPERNPITVPITIIKLLTYGPKRIAMNGIEKSAKVKKPDPPIQGMIGIKRINPYTTENTAIRGKFIVD